MTIEIELKFITTPDAAGKLNDVMARWPHQHSAGQTLSNTYYETDEGQLRGWDMGLRIRGIDDRYEMTLKTAGQTIGGLHQRPEYNIALQKPQLDILQFPAEIWPAGTNLVALQERLKPLFTTHFVREKWNVTYQESEIEVAFDRGEVSAEALSEPLTEIELELKQGQRSDLLAFATELSKVGGLRLGSLSKAARGYALAKGNAPKTLRPVPLLKVRPKATVEQGMQAAFQLALNQWQYHEALWLRGNASALNEIQEALETLRQVFSLYGTLVPRKASSELRQCLTELEDVLLEEELDAHTVCFSPLSLKTQLALTRWIAEAGWRDFMDQKNETRLQGSFKRFSDIMLGRISADLKETFSQINQPNEYQDKLTRLHRQQLAVHLLAGSYDETAVNAWLGNWQQLRQAIIDRQDIWLDGYRRQALRQSVFWKNGSV